MFCMFCIYIFVLELHSRFTNFTAAEQYVFNNCENVVCILLFLWDVCLCACMCVCRQVCIRTHFHTHILACMYRSMCIYAYQLMCMCTRIYTISLPLVLMYIAVYTYACVYVYVGKKLQACVSLFVYKPTLNKFYCIVLLLLLFVLYCM